MPTSRTPEEIARYTWLLSDEGSTLLARIREMLDAGETLLRISEKLRREHDPALIALALTQAELREHASSRFAEAPRLFFTREGLEQATSERIANHRAARYLPFERVIDLCSGIGGDLMALAELPGDRAITAVDLDPVHLMLAAHNARIVVPDQPIAPILDDVRDITIGAHDAVFIDPARRDTRGRLSRHESEPPLPWAIALAGRAAGVGIKTAPGIPHDLVPSGWELETIALGTDLKEAVLWSPSLSATSRSATVIDGDRVDRLQPNPGDPVGIVEPAPGQWLLDPNPAVTRAGLVEDLARNIGAHKIDDEIGFLITGERVQTPFARSLPILASLPWHEKQLKRVLKDLGAGPIDIRRRGLAGDVAAITRRLRGDAGGRRLTIAMTRHRGDPWAVICDTSISELSARE